MGSANSQRLGLAGASLGVVYSWTRGRRLALTSGLVESYVMGTPAMFLSDLIRTLTGLISVPGGAAVWGGGGLLDRVFWFGIHFVWVNLLATTIFKGADCLLDIRLGGSPD